MPMKNPNREILLERNLLNHNWIGSGQNKVQLSIVESGLQDNGLYEMHVNFQGEEHAAAFAINVL